MIKFSLGLFLGSLIAYTAVELTPKPAIATPQCEQPAEVTRLVNLMATMPLNIKVTEIGERPDAI